MTEQKEYQVFGVTMAQISIVYGVFLVGWGAYFSMDSESFTSWIPAILGAPVLLAGILTVMVPSKKKIWMHVAVLFGALAFLGGMMVFSKMGQELTEAQSRAAMSQGMLFVTGGLYSFVGVQAFLWARKQRAAS
jgi:hypothetical protein